jgi:hypothetical protein
MVINIKRLFRQRFIRNRLGLKMGFFIIVHESGHGWFWNSIALQEIFALVHEGFANCSEACCRYFVEKLII